ncbi:hypothetical protein RND71_035195 [Anisodus tanguticus]|uniref:Uncharacterized protein n=1 Tax=Anisodus tanguticus TaxID=243964 RepID=A0AAE1R5C7_9SOLA|nr:hypothetical protein RND71_035195 [Anisodus tanguticus]
MTMEKGSMQSNLDCFLNCTTPLVPSQFLAKSQIRNLNRLWHPWEREKVEYFKLVDLWNCYDEWSAYGAGIPIRLDTGETLVQYYVPYLSAIQIFTSTSPANFLREEAESVCEARDSFSDSLSDESESEKLSRWDGCSSEEGVVEQESLNRTNDRLGYLYFQYFERCTPYGRVPLMDKPIIYANDKRFGKLCGGISLVVVHHVINGLAERYPGLMSLRSVDLSPASWMAVACDFTEYSYPIYFMSCPDMDLEDDMENGSRKRKVGESIGLPPFGLATYKMQGDVWVSDRSGRDQERLMSLFSVADSWLKQLGVQHHDFNYMSIRRG